MSKTINWRYSKTHSSEAGFGLVEVMMAAAILGGLSLLIMKLSENGTKAVGRVEKSFEVSDLDREINSYLAKKDACTNTIGAPLSTSEISGSQSVTIPSIRNETNIEVFTSPFNRNTVTLASITLANYDSELKTANLIKTYQFKLTPTDSISKVRKAVLSLTVDSTGKAIACILKASESTGPWTVVDTGIYYDGGTVAIRDEPGIGLRALEVTGDVVTGDQNSITVPTLASNSIFGGFQNLISGDTTAASVILGGFANDITGGTSVHIVGGNGHTASGSNSALLGGTSNVVQGPGAVIAGGSSQLASGNFSFIGGGSLSSATGNYSSVIGGVNNDSSGMGAVTVGGNNLKSSGNYAGQLGGINNEVSGYAGVVVGGSRNTVTGNYSGAIATNYADITGNYSQVLGGYGWSGVQNTINSHADIIVGGIGNSINASGTSNNKYGISGIFAGNVNHINGTSQQYNAIIAGQRNEISAGGYNVIVGGYNNKFTGGGNSGIFASHTSSIAAGLRSAIIACQNCSISADGAIGQLALGWKATVAHPQSVVLSGTADPYGSKDTPFTSSAVSQFSARYSGGFRFCTNDNENGSSNNGCYTLAGGGGGLSWNSDRNLKTGLIGIDEKMSADILERILKLPVSFWKYKSHQENKKRNIGPMAQDFYKYVSSPLKLQSDEKNIFSTDLIGIELVAIKALIKKVETLERSNQLLRRHVSELQEKVKQHEP